MEESLRECIVGGLAPLAKRLAARLGLTSVTPYRRYREATGRRLSMVFRKRHNGHLRMVAAHSHCLEHVAG